MAIDVQVCFHRWLFANPVKPQRYTTGSVELVNGINKYVSGARLVPTTVPTYPVDRVCFCQLLKTQHCCLYNSHLATHTTPHSLLHAICNITVTVKKVAQNPAVLVSYIAEIVIKH